MHPSIQIFDEAAHQAIHTDIDIETLVADCQFTEGPVWESEGHYVFSDITANIVYKMVPGQKKESFISQSGTADPADEDLKPDQVGSNGLAHDLEGALLVCRHGSHMVARWKDGQLEPFITNYLGRPFNSPNDIIVDRRGRVFFSDPPYGLKNGQLNPAKFQPLGGVYCFDKGELSLICDKYQYPNGVCITPDGRQLYICSNKPVEKFISVYDLETLQFQKILAEENSDGIKCDPKGNVYLSNKDGILVLNNEGRRLALIQFPTVPANHCFGGAERKDLFVTGRERVYRIKNLLR
ncbi:SMP-30/gluconolactonase/LRE family protein [Flavisolibacter nicotianae]|uniref:SMP-30/gluconolactonase/LRE family protein n=1 Tax=Flavisolibacter nicotianae TaxID=2364882 RepID=UPI000EAD2D3E|nr:SMP-30/gluconolactonase/LRE family protein [Flavisolibacter nicotianae]